MIENVKPEKDTPIALRLVPIMTGWLLEELYKIIAIPDEIGFFMPVYSWRGVEEQTIVTKQTLIFFLERSVAAGSYAEFIEAIPPETFVWSKILSAVFINYTYIVGESYPRPYPMEITWDPPLGSYAELIEECPLELRSTLSPKSTQSSKPKRTREERKIETQKKYQAWQKRGEELREAHPRKNKHAIAKQIATEHNDNASPGQRKVTTGTVERIIKI